MSMPAVFAGHGSPMNAILDGPHRREWSALARRIPRPKAVLCVSAHWETPGPVLTASDRPPTIHDFYGFPRELHAVQYPAPGDPALARRVAGLLAGEGPHLDPERGLDHGCWGVLVAMYPEADVPVVQLGFDSRQAPVRHYELGKRLRPLRDEGVLLLASGNIVHNLPLCDFGKASGHDWAERFDAQVRSRIEAGDHGALLQPESLGPDAARAIPTPEHYLPLVYALAQQQQGDAVRLFNVGAVMGAVSMTSVEIGPSA